MHALMDGRATRGRGPEARGFRGERAQCQPLIAIGARLGG